MRWSSAIRRPICCNSTKARPGRAVGTTIHGRKCETFIYQWNGFDVYHPPHFQQKDAKNIGPVLHEFFVFHIHGDMMTVVERKLNDTWGLTARKQVARSASPAREFIPDSQSQFSRKTEGRQKRQPAAAR